MKRFSFILFCFLFLGLYGIYLSTNNTNSIFPDKENKQSNFTSVLKPYWQIKIQNAKDSFELSSLKANQDKNKEVFFLEEPIFRFFQENKLKNSASSVKAKLDLSEEKLIMTNNVHLTISEVDQKIDIFSEKINFDLKNKNFNSDQKVQLKSKSYRLESKGFNLYQNIEGGNELTFPKASFVQNKDAKNIFFGEADLLIYKSPSDSFTMLGSAEIKLDSTLFTAEEIEFNFKTKKIISLKKSKITKS